MPAIAALLNVTAERGGAAILDRRHGMPLRRRQRRAVLLTKSRAEAEEHVRHFQPFAGHETQVSGGYQVRHGWQDDVQRLQRLRDFHLLLGHLNLLLGGVPLIEELHQGKAGADQDSNSAKCLTDGLAERVLDIHAIFRVADAVSQLGDFALGQLPPQPRGDHAVLGKARSALETV